uniref:Uncharacterized protein n=1 Tax=Glossina palpalis gambiensis TaxID=67801 RepID=A0A1B0BI34_9MUSC
MYVRRHNGRVVHGSKSVDNISRNTIYICENNKAFGSLKCRFNCLLIACVVSRPKRNEFKKYISQSINYDIKVCPVLVIIINHIAKHFDRTQNEDLRKMLQYVGLANRFVRFQSLEHIISRIRVRTLNAIFQCSDR